MSDNNNEGRLINFIAGVLIGGAVGALTGLLVAPKAGAETRHQLAEGLHDTQEKASKFLDEFKGSTEKLLNDTRKTIEEKINLLSDSVKAGKKAATEAKKELSEPAKTEEQSG